MCPRQDSVGRCAPDGVLIAGELQETFEFSLCAPGRIRTCDTRFRKPVLYPLSYGGSA